MRLLSVVVIIQEVINRFLVNAEQPDPASLRVFCFTVFPYVSIFHTRSAFSVHVMNEPSIGAAAFDVSNVS